MPSSLESYTQPTRRRYAGPIVGLGFLATACTSPEIDDNAVLNSRPLIEAINETPEECQDELYAQIAEQGAIDPLTAEGCATTDFQSLQQIVSAAETAPQHDSPINRYGPILFIAAGYAIGARGAGPFIERMSKRRQAR